MQPTYGREVRATYAFSGLVAEMDGTFPRGQSEVVLEQGLVRTRSLSNTSLNRQALVRLTDERLCMIEHVLLGPDRGIEIPRAALVSSIPITDALVLTWQSGPSQSRTTRLSRFRARPSVTSAVARRYPQIALGDLSATLGTWL